MRSWEVHTKDCLYVLKDFSDNTFDSLVTDPPAGISFMGKSWDSDKGGRGEWIKWMSEVMKECARVLKPGAHGLVWALPRTSHWTATALEDAGFEVRDVVTHLFGQGFPKSLDISKAIDKAAGAEREVVGRAARPDGSTRLNTSKSEGTSFSSGSNDKDLTAPATNAAKQWQGWGTALKPASEHWILIRKPCSEKTVAANVLKHGTGGINIDGCRIEAVDAEKLEKNWTHRKAPAGFSENENTCYGSGTTDDFSYRKPQGRFPANLVLSHSEHCTDDQCDIVCAIKMLDEQSGNLKSGERKPGYIRTSRACYGDFKKTDIRWHASDSGGASRFFYCAKISASERNAGLEGMPEKVISVWGGEQDDLSDGKRSTVPKRNHHPTVKPQKLMRYLIKLITPPGGIVLDPFMGSGSTGVAAISDGFHFVGIEKEAEYAAIAKVRLIAKESDL